MTPALTRSIASIFGSALLLVASCSRSGRHVTRDAAPADAAAASVVPSVRSDAAEAGSSRATNEPPRARSRGRLDGSHWPAGILALTWDDGPDRFTSDLARYLRHEHVSATFFVVKAWVDGISEEPGVGQYVQSTGYQKLPILAELERLGHRVATHTQHHVLLPSAALDAATREILAGAEDVAPFISRRPVMFRAPGGAWTAAVGDALDAVPRDDLVGPIHWDIDGKDWEGSLYAGDARERDCEPGPLPGKKRVRPERIAQIYLDRALAAGRGIVLLHDRVGDVGSRYALRLAKVLVPTLKAKGFVFAAPVLAFGPFRETVSAERIEKTRASAADNACQRIKEFRASYTQPACDSLRHGDVNGDGMNDVCWLEAANVWCALSTGPRLLEPSVWASVTERSLELADVNGDGRADACVPNRDRATFACGLAP